jgi:hypothetical protein
VQSVVLDDPRIDGSHLLEPVDLLLQPEVCALEIGDAATGWPSKEDVAVVVAHVQHCDPEVVAVVLNLDVVLQRMLGDMLDPLVDRKADQSNYSDGDQ